MVDARQQCMHAFSIPSDQLGIILCEILNNYLPPQTPKALWKPSLRLFIYSAIDKLFIILRETVCEGLNHMFEGLYKSVYMCT